jgi:hypothetical protein
VIHEEDSERNEEIMRELQIPHVTEFREQRRKICKEQVDRIKGF